MESEKLGVLLIDLPGPQYYKYVYIMDLGFCSKNSFTVSESDEWEDVIDEAYYFTEEEAKKYPQFRWVALEEL